jgi:hypothetical protein
MSEFLKLPEKEQVNFLKIEIPAYFNKTVFDVVGKTYSSGTVKSEFPTLAGFCAKLKISKSKLMEFSQKFKEIKEELDIARVNYEHILINGGLMGSYNSKFAALATQNLIDWTSKSEDKGNKNNNPNNIIQIVLNERQKRNLIDADVVDNKNKLEDMKSDASE